MIRFERWSNAEKAYALAHLQTPLPPLSVACKKDRLDARRHCNNFAHIPRWKSNASTCNIQIPHQITAYTRSARLQVRLIKLYNHQYHNQH